MKKNAICKTKRFYILLAFFIMIMSLLIALNIHRYLIRYKANQKQLLPFHVTNNIKKSFVLVKCYKDGKYK